MPEEDRRPKYHHGPQPKYNPTVHNHLFSTTSYVARDHQHAIIGTSGPAIPRGNSHVHQLCLLTSFDPPEDARDHWHNVDMMSGPAIMLPDDQHTHYFKGETSTELRHCHCFSGAMDAAPNDEDDEDDYCEDDD